MYAPLHKPAITLPNGFTDTLLTLERTIKCVDCGRDTKTPVPHQLREWLDRYAAHPHAELDSTGHSPAGAVCPGYSEAYYCSVCHLIFTRRVYIEHHALTMLGNRNGFEWHQRVDGPNFGSMVTHTTLVPVYVQHDYHSFPVPHDGNMGYPFCSGGDPRLEADHEENGSLSLAVLYDCCLEIGNPASDEFKYDLYNARRMPAMFGPPVRRTGAPKWLRKLRRRQKQAESSSSSAGDLSTTTHTGRPTQPVRRPAGILSTLTGTIPERATSSTGKRGVVTRFTEPPDPEVLAAHRAGNEDVFFECGSTVRAVVGAFRRAGAESPSPETLAARRAEHADFVRSVREELDPDADPSPSSRPHLLDPYRDVQPCPSAAPGPVRRHDAVAAMLAHGDGSVQHTVDLLDDPHARN